MAIWAIYAERSINFDRDDLANLGRVAVICYNPTGLKIKVETGSVSGTVLEETDYVEEGAGNVDVGYQFREFIGPDTFTVLLRKRIYERLKNSNVIQLIPDHTVDNTKIFFVRKQLKEDKIINPFDRFKSPEEQKEMRPDYKIVTELTKANSIMELRVETAFIKPLHLSAIDPNYQFAIDIHARMFRPADDNVFWRKTFRTVNRIIELNDTYSYENLIANDGLLVRRIIDKNSARMAKKIYNSLNLENS